MKIIKNMLFTAALTTSVAVTAQEENKLFWESTQLADGLYMLSGVGGFTGGNLGLSIGDDGVILIDDGMPSSLEIMQEAIAKITDKPIDFLFNTHVHGDHAGNNKTLGEAGAHIVAHQNHRTHMLTKGVGKKPDGSIITADHHALPVITYTDSLDFHLNGNTAHVFHLSNAHTNGDTAVYFKQANVIHMGDVFFNKLFPYIDDSSGGSLDGYIQSQEKVLALIDDNTKIIPGHGPLASKADLLSTVEMLKAARKMVKELVDQGKSEEEILKINPLEQEFGKWSWGFIDTARMTKQVYKGVKVQSDGHHTHHDGTGHSH